MTFVGMFIQYRQIKDGVHFISYWRFSSHCHVVWDGIYSLTYEVFATCVFSVNMLAFTISLAQFNLVYVPIVRSKFINGRLEKNGVSILFDYSHMRNRQGFTCEGCWYGLSSHIDKLKMVWTLYKLLETFLPLSYDFEII